MRQTGQRARTDRGPSGKAVDRAADWGPVSVVVWGVETGVFAAAGLVVSLWQAVDALLRDDRGEAVRRFLLAVLFAAMAAIPWWPERPDDAARAF